MSTSVALVEAIHAHYDKLSKSYREIGQRYYCPERSAYDRADAGIVKIIQTNLSKDPGDSPLSPHLETTMAAPPEVSAPAPEPSLGALPMTKLRELATAYGIDLAHTPGSGKQGRHTKADLVTLIEKAKSG